MNDNDVLHDVAMLFDKHPNMIAFSYSPGYNGYCIYKNWHSLENLEVAVMKRYQLVPYEDLSDANTCYEHNGKRYLLSWRMWYDRQTPDYYDPVMHALGGKKILGFANCRVSEIEIDDSE